mmetsp:Transcript_27313/g.91798  ORF Transcript_27313/g.91798 Transcript_27313/m.91798 type:complete len:230 (-) Transcript_27313:303-992(-)
MGCPRLVYRCTAFQSNSSDVGCIESRSFSKSEVMRNRLSFVHTPGAARISQRMAFSAVCSWRWFARDDPGGLMHTLFREHFTSFGSTSLANHPRAATPTNVVAQCSRDSGAAAQPSAATADGWWNCGVGNLKGCSTRKCPCSAIMASMRANGLRSSALASSQSTAVPWRRRASRMTRALKAYVDELRTCFAASTAVLERTLSRADCTERTLTFLQVETKLTAASDNPTS